MSKFMSDKEGLAQMFSSILKKKWKKKKSNSNINNNNNKTA